LFKLRQNLAKCNKGDRSTLSGILRLRSTGSDFPIRLHDSDLARRPGGSAFAPVTASTETRQMTTVTQKSERPALPYGGSAIDTDAHFPVAHISLPAEPIA